MSLAAANFGKLLRRERQKHGISQSALAQAVGVSSRNVNAWERGREPKALALVYLVNALSLDWRVVQACFLEGVSSEAKA